MVVWLDTNKVIKNLDKKIDRNKRQCWHTGTQELSILETASYINLLKYDHCRNFRKKERYTSG